MPRPHRPLPRKTSPRPYDVQVTIALVAAKRWRAICRDCSGSIGSLVELLQGRLAKGVMDRVCREGDGLFPPPDEIKFSCSCPDWADMCKHVAATLYGIGARLDETPRLLFVLRGVDQGDLLAGAGQNLAVPRPLQSSCSTTMTSRRCSDWRSRVPAIPVPPIPLRRRPLVEPGISRTSVICDASAQTIVSYVTLSAAQIARAFLAKAHQRNKPDPVPATLLGQLAIHRTHQGKGHARSLLLFALTAALRASRDIGSFGVLTHPIDEQVRQFYLQWGFEDVPFDPKRSKIVRMVDLVKSGAVG